MCRGSSGSPDAAGEDACGPIAFGRALTHVVRENFRVPAPLAGRPQGTKQMLQDIAGAAPDRPTA